jgi:hypothetical protein
VIYVVAAYSITVGTLALYAGLLLHRARVLSGALSPSRIDPRRGFNVGAALLAPIWMFAHGLRVPGAILLALWISMIPVYARGMWIPLWLMAATAVAASAALGFVGNRIVVDRIGVRSVGDLSTGQWPWALAGIVSYGFVLPWLWYFLSGHGGA